jgi:hypothetical protein
VTYIYTSTYRNECTSTRNNIVSLKFLFYNLFVLLFILTSILNKEIFRRKKRHTKKYTIIINIILYSRKKHIVKVYIDELFY